MLSPIRLTPNMDMNTLVTAINNMFTQIQNENRTQIITDASGVNRILIGLAPASVSSPNTQDYIFAITVPGKDVVTELTNGS